MKNLFLSCMILFGATTSFSQTRVLYFADGISGTDYMAPALTSLGCIVTTVTTHAAFQTAIATPADFDVAIEFIQSNFPDPTSVTALANFMAIPGKKGMYSDWSLNNSYAANFGANFTGNVDNNTVTITDATIAAGLTTNPFTVYNSGWGTYSTGLVPLTGGVVLGTFSDGEAALLSTMSGNMLVFGFTDDATSSSEIFVAAMNYLVPPTSGTITTSTAIMGPLCSGASLNVDFTVTGSFSGGNVFTAELSDASGSFASPTSIGTLSGTSSGTIIATIPASASGVAYRVRVTSSAPAVTGSDNGTDLLIGAPTANVTASTIDCHGGMSTVVVSGTGGSAPYTGTGTFSVPAGPYSYTIIDANGCSSPTVSDTITEPAAIDVSTTTAGNVITANESTATYQWIDCGTNMPISGETNQSFTATSNGNYAVIVTQGSCKDTSACQAITTTGINSLSNDNNLLVYPNPANGAFNIRMASVQTGMLYVNITDIQGQCVLRLNETVSGNINKQISLQNLSKGLYYVQVTIGTVQKTDKLIIE